MSLTPPQAELLKRKPIKPFLPHANTAAEIKRNADEHRRYCEQLTTWHDAFYLLAPEGRA